MYKKITAIITAALTLAVMCGAPAVAFASDGTSVTKKESVYVITGSDGLQNEVIVSDHLVNESKINKIADKSDLTDIENVKGEEKFTRDGKNITWAAKGSDIYYQGKTDKEVPVTMDVKYILDGKEISGQELQGKSGRLAIKISYENNARYNAQTVPMVVMSGLIVTDDSFSDITIDHGKVINSGDRQVVVGFALPGLAQSMDIDENKLGMGSSVTIRGTAEKFGVTDIMTIATSDLFDDVDTSKLDDLDYDEQINQLDKGSKKLVSGTKELSDGLEKLNTGVEAIAGKSGGKKGLIPTFESLRDAVPKLSYAASTVDESLNTISGNLGSDSTENTLIWMSNMLDKGLNSAKSSLSTASEASEKAEDSLNAAETSLDSAKDEIRNAENKNDRIKETIENNKEALESIESGDSNLYDVLISQVSESASGKASAKIDTAEKQLDNAQDEISTSSEASEELGDSLASAGSETGLGTVAAYLHNGLISLQSGISGSETVPAEKTLLYATGSLSKGLAQMSETITKATDESNPENVIKALETVKSGSSELTAGSARLSAGMSKLYRQGIRKIVDLYNDELKGLTGSLSSVVEAGKGYKTFTVLPSGMDGSVQFIYKTKISE